MEMVKTLFSQHTNMHNSCCGNYALWQEKKTLPLSFNILLCYDWKKSFYTVKTQQSIFSTTAALTLKAYGESRQWQ